MVESDSRVPVTILTGFLGSGKTTLLNHILTAKHGKKLAIIENEFGEVGIDDALLQRNMKEHQEEEIIEMMNGCICCTVRQDLIVVLEKLAARVESGGQLDGIVIETTGMADPAPVAQTFFVDEKVQKFARLDGIVTLIDAKHIEQHLDEVKPEGAENEAVEQVAFADRLILNKCDLVPGETDLARVEARLRALNAFAPILRSTKSIVDVGQVLDIEAFDLKRTLEMDAEFLNTEGEHEHDSSVTSLCFNSEGELNMDLLNEWISDLLKTKGAEIYRMKGVLALAGADQKYVYQAVHMIFNGEFVEPWGDDEPRVSKLVFIGKNLDHAALKKSFDQCIATPGNMQASFEKVQTAQQGSLLLGASQQNDSAKLQELIDAGVPVEFKNGMSQTALHIAVLWGNFEACEVLVRNGASLNAQNTMTGATPLHMAACSSKSLAGRLKCVRLVVGAGAELTVKDDGGHMAWQYAADPPSDEEEAGEDDGKRAGQEELVALLRPADGDGGDEVIDHFVDLDLEKDDDDVVDLEKDTAELAP